MPVLLMPVAYHPGPGQAPVLLAASASILLFGLFPSSLLNILKILG